LHATWRERENKVGGEKVDGHKGEINPKRKKKKTNVKTLIMQHK
jgi:hypothetical protein